MLGGMALPPTPMRRQSIKSPSSRNVSRPTTTPFSEATTAGEQQRKAKQAGIRAAGRARASWGGQTPGTLSTRTLRKPKAHASLQCAPRQGASPGPPPTIQAGARAPQHAGQVVQDGIRVALVLKQLDICRGIAGSPCQLWVCVAGAEHRRQSRGGTGRSGGGCVLLLSLGTARVRQGRGGQTCVEEVTLGHVDALGAQLVDLPRWRGGGTRGARLGRQMASNPFCRVPSYAGRK